jgi:hypothetical protein
VGQVATARHRQPDDSHGRQSGGSVQDDYFQSQTILDLKDVPGRIPYRIEVRCNRPNYLISQDLLGLRDQRD